MKKIILSTLLLCSTALSYAQLTTPTFPNKVLNMTTAPNGTTPASFSSTTGGPFVYLNKYHPTTGQIMNKWQIVTLPHENSLPTIWAESSYDTSLLPPCNDFWKQGNSYFQIIFTGTGCVQLPIDTIGSGAVIILPGNPPRDPVYTSNQIQTIPNPQVGDRVFDFSKGYTRTWNGTIWSPL